MLSKLKGLQRKDADEDETMDLNNILEMEDSIETPVVKKKPPKLKSKFSMGRFKNKSKGWIQAVKHYKRKAILKGRVKYSLITKKVPRLTR